ncbi:mariner Mos1 transposase [Trichonephila clavipes]|nr:mariner Mos1 transposase [Trichonephila clavipes]
MSAYEPNSRHLREVLISCFNMKKSVAEAHRMLSNTYGEAAISERTCREWFQRFKNDDFDVEDQHGIWTATAGSDVVQSGRPIFEDFFQHLWPYIGNNTANAVFQMVKLLWLIRIDK